MLCAATAIAYKSLLRRSRDGIAPDTFARPFIISVRHDRRIAQSVQLLHNRCAPAQAQPAPPAPLDSTAAQSIYPASPPASAGPSRYRGYQQLTDRRGYRFPIRLPLPSAMLKAKSNPPCSNTRGKLRSAITGSTATPTRQRAAYRPDRRPRHRTPHTHRPRHPLRHPIGCGS